MTFDYWFGIAVSVVTMWMIALLHPGRSLADGAAVMTAGFAAVFIGWALLRRYRIRIERRPKAVQP